MGRLFSAMRCITCQAVDQQIALLGDPAPGLSNTMHADFCVDALNEAIAKYGPPEIMNTPSRHICCANTLSAMDQGSQFTGSAWITALAEVGVRISMDGRGRYLDNIFPLIVCPANDCRAMIERPWRSLKQKAIYIEKSPTGSKPAASSRIGWHSTTPSDPIRRLIGSPPTTHIAQAWKRKKQHET